MNIGHGGFAVNGNMVLQGQVDVLCAGRVDIAGCLGTTCNGKYLSRQSHGKSGRATFFATMVIAIFQGKRFQAIVGAGSQGFIFINASGGIIVEENGLLFADKFIAVTDASTIILWIKNALGWWNAARPVSRGDYAQVPMQRYCRRRLESQKTPRNEFYRRRLDAEWLHTGAWLFGC